MHSRIWGFLQLLPCNRELAASRLLQRVNTIIELPPLLPVLAVAITVAALAFSAAVLAKPANDTTGALAAAALAFSAAALAKPATDTTAALAALAAAAATAAACAATSYRAVGLSGCGLLQGRQRQQSVEARWELP